MIFWSSLAEASTLLPPQASNHSTGYDSLYIFLLVASAIACVLLIGGIVYFALKYRRRSDTDKTAYITHNTTLEFLWSFIPFCIFLFVFVWGWIVYERMRSVPKNAFEIHVEGRQWDWLFRYKSGKQMVGEVYVPAEMPVKFIMTSKDVIHSFYVPSFRIKQDVVPGMYSVLWFNSAKPGIYSIYCAEYCGTRHSAMLAKVHVLPLKEFEAWLSGEKLSGGGDKAVSLAQQGEQVFKMKACASCHSLDGSKVVGPTFKGLFGRKEQFEDGGSVVVDENYIRESILNPNKHIVKGYPSGQMPTFQGQIEDTEVTALIEFIKSAK